MYGISLTVGCLCFMLVNVLLGVGMLAEVVPLVSGVPCMIDYKH